MSNDCILLSIACLYLVLISLAISVIDIRRFIIPNSLNAAHFGGGLIWTGVLKVTSLPSALAGGVLGFCVFLLLRYGYRSLRGQDGLGLGDVKFMAGAGLWVGWQGLAPLLLIASVSALIYLALSEVRKGRIDHRRRVPFGPFLCTGTLAVWGAQALDVAFWTGLP